MYIDDTIAAISTPLGEGGVGVIRISGHLAGAIGQNIFSREIDGGFESHRFYYGSIVEPASGERIDEAMVVLMRAPRSYTREDVLEVQCHGGYLVVKRVLALVLRQGARLAEPGEFTRRAFLNGRIDLVQAESVIDVIRSKTDAALSLAQQQRQGILSKKMYELRDDIVHALALVEAHLDFPEEDLGEGAMREISAATESAVEKVKELLSTYKEGRALREGVSVVIAGKPNAGKSSLLNNLLQEKRAIVTSQPGTTRDVIEEVVNIGGLPVRLLDTAGVCEADDPIEQEGVSRALEKIRQADLVLFMLDASRAMDRDDWRMELELGARSRIVVMNKCDLPEKISLTDSFLKGGVVRISTKTGSGIEALKAAIHDHFIGGTSADSREFVVISTVRQRDALTRCDEYLGHFQEKMAEESHLEILAAELREALGAIGELTGQAASDEVLDRIFQRFCIGK